MKRQFAVLACLFLPVVCLAQNWAAVSSSNLTDLNQQKLAAGTLCFLGTDQNDVPISFQVGGGGQVLARPFCVAVTNGSSAALTVPNPQNTQPQGIYYRVTVTDSSTGQAVLRYKQVSFAGGNFNLDQYVPQYPGFTVAPLSTSTPGNFSIGGNLSVTGTITGTYVFGSSSFSALNSAATFGTYGSVTDKQRGMFIQNYLQTHWIPVSPWLNLDNYTRGDAVYLNAACSFTSGNYTITCTGANFSSSTDVGKLVVLFGARANGSGAAATTTLSGGAVTTPTMTANGSGYLTAPSVSVSGLTCTYNPELRAVLSGSNYSTGNTVSSITVVYGGSGCTGTPSITIMPGPNLALAGSISSVTNATTIVLTTNVAPSVTAGSQSMLYGSDDTSNLNSAIAALAPNNDEGLNPLAVYCGRLYMTSGVVNVVNKSLNLVSPGPANLSSTGSGTPAQLGCGIYLVNQSYTAPVDALYVAGSQFSSIRGVHIYSVSGNKQRAAIRLQQPGGGTTNHNNQYNRFEDNLIGPWYTGGANGGDPEANSCFTGSFVLNQCAQFLWGFMFDSPSGYPTTGGANNDQTTFSNNMVVGADIGFYVFANQSAELNLSRFMCDGCNVGIQSQANLSCRECDISNSRTADIQLGDAAYSGNNGLFRLDLLDFTSEGSHQFLTAAAESGGTVNNISVFLHGLVSWQVGNSTIQSGTLVDFSPQAGGGNVAVNSDNGITILGVLPATTAPVNYKWYGGPSYATGPNYVQNGANLAGNVPDPPMSQWPNVQLTYPDYRQSQWFKRDWLSLTGQRCHTDMIFFGGDPDSIECNNTTIIGKQRLFGELLVNQIGTPGSPTCAKLSGSGSTTYYYKIAGVVAGITGPASVEASCASQNAALSSSAVNQACAIPIAGAQKYTIYESTTSGSEKLLATVNADQMVSGSSNTVCYNDNAGGAAGASPFSTDATGGATFQGPVTAQGLTLTGLTPLAAPALNINGDGNMTKNPRIPWATYYPALASNTSVVMNQWTNTGPFKVISLALLNPVTGVGCTTSNLILYDVAKAQTVTTMAIPNGQNSTIASGINYSVASGDTLQVQYTAAGCSTYPQQLNITVEVEPQ